MFKRWFAVLCLSCALLWQGCGGDEPKSHPATGNETIDEIVTAVLTGDSATVERYWDRPARGCSSKSEGSRPRCEDGETEGTLVREGVYRCGVGTLRYEESDFGLDSDWSLYTVELDESVGLKYRIVLSRAADERAVELVIRTPKPGLEDVFSVSFMSYSELCISASEATADVQTFLIPPPELRNCEL